VKVTSRSIPLILASLVGLALEGCEPTEGNDPRPPAESFDPSTRCWVPAEPDGEAGYYQLWCYEGGGGLIGPVSGVVWLSDYERLDEPGDQKCYTVKVKPGTCEGLLN
jgi:hypothetical protein